MKRLLLLGLLALLPACQNTPPRIGDAPSKLESAEEAEYRQILDRYTDHKEVYALFDTRMFVAVTYQSWPFREARTKRVGKFQGWPDSLVQQRLGEEKAESEQSVDFFMGVHMNDRTEDDFDRKNSIWRIALITPAGEVTPVKIERTGRSTLDQRAIYPYMGDFWVGYVLKFPKTLADGSPTVPDGATELQLRIASTVGKAELKFPAR